MPQESVAATTEQWAALAVYVKRRRQSLGIKQRSAGPPSTPVWSILENAKQKNGTMAVSTLTDAAKALRLTRADALIRILEGRDPDLFEPETAIPDPGLVARVAALEERVSLLERTTEYPEYPELAAAKGGAPRPSQDRKLRPRSKPGAE